MRTASFALSLGLLLAAPLLSAPAHADVFKVTVGGAGEQSANTAALCSAFGSGTCTVGTETFTNRVSGAGFTTDFGTGGTIKGTYSNVQINAADQYGGAGGTGSYAVAFGGTPYSVNLTTTLASGVNYFGFWLSALDSGNLVTFYKNGNQLYQFTPNDLIAQLGSCTNGNAYCTNPNSNFAGQNNQLYAFVNFFDTNGSFDQIGFSESPAVGGYESDNHTVGYVTSTTGTPVKVPEPATALVLGSALVGLGLARRRRA